MTVTYHRDLMQGTDEWLSARCGLITASEMKLLLTPTLRTARNEKTRAHLYELTAQRITRYTEPTFIGDDMLRGMADEVLARELYAQHYGEVEECGFITNDRWGFTLGYSPDGLVGLDGLLEVKSRRQKYQVETILSGEVPVDYILQCQTGIMTAERQWLDFISYSGGLPMVTIRVHPDDVLQNAILEAASDFEAQIADALADYKAQLDKLRTIPTDRTIEQEMFT